MKWLIRAVLVLALLVLCALGWTVYVMFTPHVKERAGRTYNEYIAQFGETDLPRTAQNIRYVASSVGLGGRAYLRRFEAPAEECKMYALIEYGYYDLDRAHAGKPPQFEPISSRPEKPDLSAYDIRDLSWFDIENVVEGITLRRDHSHRPFIFIDVKRNIYYSFWTD